jgi:predicted nucleic acid-binding protein
LIAIFHDEAQSDQMRQISTNEDVIGVCRISWAETMAALARRQREDPNSGADLEEARQHLIHSWSTFSIVEVNQPLVETAGRFADVFALRGYDSVQLAAAHELHVNAEQTVVFASYDRRLNQADLLLQLEVLS